MTLAAQLTPEGFSPRSSAREWWGLLGISLLAPAIGGAPLQAVLGGVGGVALIGGMLIVPTLGLHALLVAIPFAPSVTLGDGDLTIPGAEPFALLLLAVWMARGLARGSLEFPRDGVMAALGLLLLALILSGISAYRVQPAAKEILKWALLAFAYVFTATRVRDARLRAMLVATMLFAAAGQGIEGVVQSIVGFGPPTFAIGGFMRAHGEFGQPNPFAGYLGTILPIAVMVALTAPERRLRWIAAVAGACIGLGILFSLSRGAWLGLAVAVLAMAFAWSSRTRQALVPVVAVSVLVFALGVVGALPPTLADRIRSVADNFGVFDARGVQPTSENFAIVERMAHWQAGWYMFREQPWQGVGAGNYPVAYEDYFLPGWKDPLGHAHNYYINMAAEAGIPGLAALLLLLAVALSQAIANLRRSVTPGDRGLALGLLGSIVLLCTHSVFDNLLVHGVGIHLGVLLGLTASSGDATGD
ncbi:MAG: O-antigen ligase family protein [Chloroflexota bacterium]